jgi:hypothetical protein
MKIRLHRRRYDRDIGEMASVDELRGGQLTVSMDEYCPARYHRRYDDKMVRQRTADAAGTRLA